MAKIVVLGAGISGHTASALLKKKLGKKHEVVVVTPNAYYHWIPSNIWVGVGRMTVDQVRFRLDKRYEKVGIGYKQAKAVSFHPEGDDEISKGFVSIQYTGQDRAGEVEKVDYDFLINATKHLAAIGNRALVFLVATELLLKFRDLRLRRFFLFARLVLDRLHLGIHLGDVRFQGHSK